MFYYFSKSYGSADALKTVHTKTLINNLLPQSTANRPHKNVSGPVLSLVLLSKNPCTEYDYANEHHGIAVTMTTINIDLILTKDFNLAAIMTFVDPFRVANYIEGAARFKWRFLSENGETVRASNGTYIKATRLPDKFESRPDYILVSSSWTPEAHISNRMRAYLRFGMTYGFVLGGLDTGAFILANCGPLNGYKATTHYEHLDAMKELYPETEVTDTLWVFDRDRISCCGGMASCEFALHIIQQSFDTALANAAARYIFSQNLRTHNSPQNPQVREPFGKTVPDRLRKAIKVMEDHLETPLSIVEISKSVGLSHRQLNCLFSLHVSKTPSLYYRDIRLDLARGLVTQTSLSMT